MGLGTSICRSKFGFKQYTRILRRPHATSLQNHETDIAASTSNGKQAKRRNADRDVFLSVLSATATKRDAKSYLSRFKPKSTAQAPKPAGPLQEPSHVALLKIRACDTLVDEVIHGVAETISQLDRLGLHSIIVVDIDRDKHQHAPWWVRRALLEEQVIRMVRALRHSSRIRARRLDSVLGVNQLQKEVSSTAKVRGAVEVQYGNLLHGVLARGSIPVIPPIAYTTQTQHAVLVPADEVVMALTRAFAGFQSTLSQADSNSSSAPMQNFVLDRIILLDPVGGLPSTSRSDSAHIFVNLEQEYKYIRDELLAANDQGHSPLTLNLDELDHKRKPSVFGSSNPISGLLEQQISPPASPPSGAYTEEGSVVNHSPNHHVQNLDLLRNALLLLPPSASALLTTPFAAATFSSSSNSAASDFDVRTRRPKNPLIFNLLTDKPLVSSSLPTSRLHPTSATSIAPVTFIKRGMPLTIVPDPHTDPWEPPDASSPRLSLSDPRVDLPRLLTLIEDSFSRRLDLEHYIARTRDKIAGIIVAGSYEGGAILTWELPPGVEDDGTEATRRRMVPYLDKFAVLKRSQGAGGVADILFTAMVRTCFPNGVCWRSRKDNPVNKWYFERSVGTLKLPDSKWTMFWTTEGLVEDRSKFRDYESVCRNIGASWADNGGGQGSA